MKFTIDEQYICNVTVRSEYDLIEDRSNPTHEDFIKILKGWDKMSSTSSIDHEEFTKLRNQLEAQGYIKTERNYWNGDTVLKTFYLNDIKFKKGDRFLSAGAMKVAITVARTHGRKYNPKY